MMPDIEFQYFPGCPHAEDALRLVESVASRLLPGREVASILIAGVDIEGKTGGTGNLSCRLYESGGVPPEWMAEGLSEEEKLDAFRRTRDELRHRLEILFRSW